jgi:hypothetical protein
MPPPSSSSITVGNGTSIPVTSRGHFIPPTPTTNFALNNILVAPSIVRNLLFVRQFTRDNSCSFEFDAHGFFVKDLRTGRVILHCNCDGDLYTMPASTAAAPPHALPAASSTLWHQRLGHPAPATLERPNKVHVVSCNKVDRSLCHSCQIGKHTHLPFSSSLSITHAPFELVHCDVWTSPINSLSGFSYYLVCLDDYSHYCWVFPLRKKSEVHQHLVELAALAKTQFSSPIKCFQADNGAEFINTATTKFFAAQGTHLCSSCPYTSPQNGKAKRIIRTLNNSIRTMLLHASLPPAYWVEGLLTACYLHNRRPSSSIKHDIPYTRLHNQPPTYNHLRVFGCLCYPNMQATSKHKLAPCSTACVFLGYPPSHKGYRCLDLSTCRIISAMSYSTRPLSPLQPPQTPPPTPPMTFSSTTIWFRCFALLLLQVGLPPRRPWSLHPPRMLSSHPPTLRHHMDRLLRHQAGMVTCPRLDPAWSLYHGSTSAAPSRPERRLPLLTPRHHRRRPHRHRRHRLLRHHHHCRHVPPAP